MAAAAIVVLKVLSDDSDVVVIIDKNEPFELTKASDVNVAGFQFECCSLRVLDIDCWSLVG